MKTLTCVAAMSLAASGAYCQTAIDVVKEAVVVSDKLSDHQGIMFSQFFTKAVVNDYNTISANSRGCDIWDGNLITRNQSETDAKVIIASLAASDDRSAKVRAKIALTFDDTFHKTVEETFFLVQEDGRWKIDEIHFPPYDENEKKVGYGTIHAYLHELAVKGCN